jgi:hypothetical protein
MTTQMNQYGVIRYFIAGQRILLPVKFVHFFEEKVLAIVMLDDKLIDKYKDIGHAVAINNVANQFYHSIIVNTFENLQQARMYCDIIKQSND